MPKWSISGKYIVERRMALQFVHVLAISNFCIRALSYETNDL